MKRILYILSAMIAATFASCSNEDMGNNNNSETREVYVNAIADYAMADGAAMPQVRGTATADRYVIEVYDDAAYTTQANVLEGRTTYCTSNTTGEFAMTLDAGKAYYCLLWADKNVNGEQAYNIDNLKSVSLIAGKKPTEAFCGTLKIEEKKTTYSVSLHRAVARIVLKETGTLPAGQLTIKFNQKTSFDVSNSTTIGDATERTDILSVGATTGTKDAPVAISPDAIFVLAPVNTAVKESFTFQYASEEEFSVADVQVQANYNTNITGHYSNN